jgi:general secretion pathway protein E
MSPIRWNPATARLERLMTDDESLQFFGHLRQNNHLTNKAGDGELAKQSGPQGLARGKLWEHINLSASEFADETARSYGLERITLQDMWAATPEIDRFSQQAPAKVASSGSGN